MSYLLDTHTLLWWLDENPILSNQAVTIISSPQNIIRIEVFSFFCIIFHPKPEQKKFVL